MDKKKSGKSKKKTKDLFAKLDSQFKSAVKKKSQKENSSVEKPVVRSLTIPPPKAQLPREMNPPPIKTDRERKSELFPNHSQKSAYERMEVEEKKLPVQATRKEVNKRGRVGEFRKEALLRQIPIGLQREEYRETAKHTANELISEIVRSGPLKDDVSNVFGSKFDGKTIGLHLRKATKRVPARISHPKYVTARREWLNAQERKDLQLTSMPTDLQYEDYLFLNECWNEYYNSINGSGEELQKEIHAMAKEGCHIRVIRSNSPEDMGVEGIILLESKNQFVLVTTKNKVRKVAKPNHVFQVMGVEKPFVLYGSYLCGNSDFEFRRQPHKQLFSLNASYY